jgi:hypothetical protein
MPAVPFDPPLVANVRNPLPAPVPGLTTPSCKRLACMLSLLGTSVAYLMPDHICKKFINGQNIHDKGCLFKDKSTANSSHNILTLVDSHILTNTKPVSDDGELDLTFDEWHQAWRHLLNLIKSYISKEFLLWEVHYLSILNHDNQAEMWPLFLTYDTEICERSTHLPINPSKFSIGI